MGRVTVRTPATSANLGPGYDSFGLALSIYNHFSAELAEEWTVDVTGVDSESLSADASNPVAMAIARAFAEVGREGQAASVWCENGIPTGRGLGSSAAAIVGGLMLGFALAGTDVAADDLIRLATSMEGHPDNVAATVLGGFTVSARDDHGEVLARTLPVAPCIAAVVAVSRLPFKTTRSRKLLPESVSHADAATNSAHAAMLAAGLMIGDKDLIAHGAIDRIHEVYRLSSLPGFEDVRAALVDAGAMVAVLSGAGPTVVGFVCANDDDEAPVVAERVAKRAESAVERTGSYRAPMAVAVDRGGAIIVEHQP